MYRRFPIDLLPLLRCFHDRGELVFDAGSAENGTVRCTTCSRHYPISDGVLSFLEPDKLNPISATEMRVRDGDTDGYDKFIESLGPESTAEIQPMLAALQPLSGATVLELGCGTGRYTIPIVRDCRSLVGVDFSMESLRALSRKLPESAHVALVQADITRLCVASEAFDRVTSTLVSNLPTDDARAAMYRLAKLGLTAGGCFVFSTHNYGIREWLRREPIEGNYTDSYAVYRRLFRPKQILSEANEYFGDVRCRRIAIIPPLARKVGIPIYAFSRFAESVPGLNEFASLLLFTAAGARRPALENQS
jgi:SAM-dependent methyltransferase